MKPAYANARLILPYGLLRWLRRYFPEGLLWVPPPGRHSARDHRLLRAFRRGVSIARLAADHRLGPETVRRIVKSLAIDRMF